MRNNNFSYNEQRTLYTAFLFTGLNISTKNTGQKRELNQEVCKVPGFTALQWLLPKHSNIPEVYFLMMALLLGQHVNKLPTDVEVLLASC